MNSQARQVTTASRLFIKLILKGCGLGCLLLLFFSISAFADTHYVSLSGSHTAPFTDWATAARDIQAAIDAASAGDTILVTNGVYDTGGRLAGGQVLTNRVAIDKPLVVRSVNGPEVTIIKGVGPYGDAAIRCVYLGTNATLIGLTLTNGYTRDWHGYYLDACGGGIFCESSAVLSNCVLTGNRAYEDGGGTYGGKLYNCMLTGNSAYKGGGARAGTLYNCTLTGNLAGNIEAGGGGAISCTLYNCTLTGNSAGDGGGASHSTLYNCMLSGNSANSGGGTLGGTLYNCTLTGNSAYYGGGASGGTLGGTLYNCTLTGNSASYSGGGADRSTLYNCALTDNSASLGGGAYYGTLYNCTLTGNSAYDGGGAFGGTQYNCIVYYNTASLTSHDVTNYSGGILNYCCTTPLPSGTGNITSEPQFVNTNGDYHLASGSPCIDAGNNAYATGSTDLDGRSRIIGGTVDMGCYEAPRIYVGGSPIHYVSPSGGNVWPYTNWATAATIFQHAVDAANAGDTVLVTNGVYDTGGCLAGGQVLTNRVAIDKPLVVRSVNGPEVTIIKGAGPYGDAAIRCVYLGTNAALIGFTLTNGHTRVWHGPDPDVWGGGIFCEPLAVLSNCVLTGNWADEGGGTYLGTFYNCTLAGNRAYSGGGASYGTLYNCTLTSNSAFGGDPAGGGGAAGGTLYNCTLTGNSAGNSGGGVYYGTLYNCTLTGNSAGNSGGGAYGGTLYNCIVYYNTALNGPNFLVGTLNYCCTTPLPSGEGNITAEPLFVNTNGNYHLASGSPCIDAGNNAHAAGSTDLDGRSRIIGGTVDMGCYEAPRIYVGGSPIHYVSPSGGNVWPYTNWATAATILQHAVDAANAGDTVLVTNGIYDTGGCLVGGQVLTNRVAIDKPLVVRSVNGPEVTIVKGAGPYGDAAIRCVYLGPNAALIGFTLTNGHTRAWHGPYPDVCGGGIFCESSAVLSNCVLIGNRASDCGGGTFDGTFYNCTLTGNSAYKGGGAYGGTLYNCTLTDNSANSIEGGGGGAEVSTLYNCTLTGNWANNYGGGADRSTLYNCTLTGNSTVQGGGASYSALYNCTLTGNRANNYGGGADRSTLYNCALTGNSATLAGGGAEGSTLYNCTLTGNSAYDGGGAFGGTQYNCIVYYNTASLTSHDVTNYSGGTLNYCCTTPLPSGTGNITSEPQFVNTNGDYHLASGSPCIDAGNNAYAYAAGSTDLDGRSRIIGGVVDMGCYEAPQIHPGNSPVHYVSLLGGNVWPYTNWATAAVTIQGAVDAAASSDTILVTNGVYDTGGKVLQGGTITNRVVIDKAVQIQSVNGPDVTVVSGNGSARCFYLSNTLVLVSGFTITGGMTLYQMGYPDKLDGGGVYIDHGGTVEHCIIQGNKTGGDNDGPPRWGPTHGGGAFVNGEGIIRSCTISNNTAWGITSGGGGGIFLNGGGLVEKCVITKNSTSGSETDGGGISCSGGGIVRDCVISQNSARWWGGGVVCYSGGTVENCLIYSNTAYDRGGGIYLYGSGEARNCTITGNSATYGGGTYSGTLYNCTLTGNHGGLGGGGAYGGTLNNCIVHYNDAVGGTNFQGSTFNYSCTTPNPGGTGNITNEPQFVNAAAGDYHLSADSPCRDKGDNAYAQGTTDLDGNPRIVNGTVDMGAYEYQVLVGYWAWASAITNGLTNFNQCATGDGYPNLLKYATGSSPTNSDNLARLNCGLSNEWFLLWFNRNTNAADVTLIVEGAYALTYNTAWNGVATNVNGSWGNAANVAETGATNPAKVTVREPVAAATNRFMRLRVTWP